MKTIHLPILLADFDLGGQIKLWAIPVAIALLGAWIATWLGSFVIGKIISPYANKLQIELLKREKSALERGFPNGGRIIGQLERFLIYLFVLSGQPTGVGFLVAAKSVFRFGQLTSTTTASKPNTSPLARC